MRLTILTRWSYVAALALVYSGAAVGASWRREDLSGAGVGGSTFASGPRALAGDDVSVWGGRILVKAPRVPSEDVAAFAAETEARLQAAFDDSGWKIPFSDRNPLRVMLVSAPGLSFSNVFNGGKGDAVVALNVAGHPPAESASEAVRDVALVVLRASAPAADPGLGRACARALSLADDLLDADREELRETGSGVDHAMGAGSSEIFAGQWIREMAKTAGPDFLRSVWMDRVARGESSFDAYSAAFRETGGSPADAMTRALARLYAADEVFPDASRLNEADLTAGALDAADPGRLAWRFYASSPAAAGGWNVAWPEDAADGFAVLHYEDGLPSDVVRFSAGDGRTLPAAGVSRIDWVVIGREGAPAPLAVPVTVAADAAFPMTGLSASVRSEGGEGVVLSWQTASHRNLSGWAILRSEVTEDGRVIRTEPEALPSQENDPAGASYDFVDTSAVAGHYYRYDVWAVTSDGAMSRAFRTTLRAK
jgi:hypothetical protein